MQGFEAKLVPALGDRGLGVVGTEREPEDWWGC
jgi:hypothetical protein